MPTESGTKVGILVITEKCKTDVTEKIKLSYKYTASVNIYIHLFCLSPSQLCLYFPCCGVTLSRPAVLLEKNYIANNGSANNVVTIQILAQE